MGAPAALWAHTQALHRSRTQDPAPVEPDMSDPELAAAYHVMQLHWLATVPGYREEVKAHVSEVARRADALARRIERQYADRYVKVDAAEVANG